MNGFGVTLQIFDDSCITQFSVAGAPPLGAPLPRPLPLPREKGRPPRSPPREPGALWGGDPGIPSATSPVALVFPDNAAGAVVGNTVPLFPTVAGPAPSEIILVSIFGTINTPPLPPPPLPRPRPRPLGAAEGPSVGLSVDSTGVLEPA